MRILAIGNYIGKAFKYTGGVISNFFWGSSTGRFWGSSTSRFWGS